MPNPNPVFLPKPFSLAGMRAAFAKSDPKALAMMTELMPWDYFHRTYEFQEATLNADWTAVVTAGGGPTAFAFNAQRNGALQGATGTTDNDATALHYHAAIFDPADNPFFWLRWIAPGLLTNFSFEIGFSDPKTSEALPAVSDVDTPTVANGVTDLGCVHMDTDQTLTTAAIVADGTTGAAASATLVNRAGTAWTPTASAIIDVIVGIRPNKTNVWIWDSLAPMGIMQAVAQGPDSGVLVRPYALFRTRNTTTKTIQLLKAVVCSEENRTS